ncbi:MAG: Extracellular phospholipase A1 precursor [bacterium ADurb.BinA028]|nr:MAG: Extracellular phospholipase A1 precursor [bacterium ADurb.BinA028]
MVLTEGADVEALARSVSLLHEYGKRIGTVRTVTDAIVIRLGHYWAGNDQRSLSIQWNRSHGPSLEDCRRLVVELAQTVAANAGEQRDASNGVADGVGAFSIGTSAQSGWHGEGTSSDKQTDARNASALLAFAADAYGDSKGQLPAGWAPVPTGELASLGLSPKDLVGSDGFRAAVYRDADGHVVMAFAGTDPTSRQDWATNLAQGAGYRPSQYEKAILISMKVAAHVGPSNLVLTGHSLGGGLAAAASLATGASAITFNAAGVNSNIRSELATINPGAAAGSDRLIHNYYVVGEPLTALQNAQVGPQAVGTQVRLPSALTADAEERIRHSAAAAADAGADLGRAANPFGRLPFLPSLGELAGQASGYAVGTTVQTEVERHNVSGVKSSLDAYGK